MANTYTQLYIHCVFAVKYRQALISPEWEDRLKQYITAIVQNQGHKMLAIDGVDDHLHIFVGFNPSRSVSETMRVIKGDSSEWVNNERLTRGKFQWQEGYGAFSHSRSQIDPVVKYINNQKEHHKKTTFLDEYKKMLSDFEIDFDDRYIFSSPIE